MKKVEPKQDGGWGNDPDLNVKKQPSEDVDLGYLKNIKRANTIRQEEEPEDELDGLLDEIGVGKS